MQVYLNKDSVVENISSDIFSDSTCDEEYSKLVHRKIPLKPSQEEEMWFNCNQDSCSSKFVTQLAQASSTYTQRRKDNKNYHLCIHIKTRANGPSNHEKTSTLAVHGFLWDEQLGLELAENDNGFKLKIKITLIGSSRPPVFSIIETEFPLFPAQNPESTGNKNPSVDECFGNERFCKVEHVPFGNILWNSTPGSLLDSSSGLCALVDVSLERELSLIPDMRSINKKILDSSLHSDVSIVVNNEAELKCHKSILSAHSPVFAAMFESGMRESGTNKILMVDMSEEIGKAFLEYLYTWDVTAAKENSTVALELLKAGHKYDMRHLEEKMKSLFLYSSADDMEWWDAEVALRLYLFLRNVDDDAKDLKYSVARLLATKWWKKEILESKFFKDSVKEDPTGMASAGFELFSMMSEEIQGRKPGCTIL